MIGQRLIASPVVAVAALVASAARLPRRCCPDPERDGPGGADQPLSLPKLDDLDFGNLDGDRRRHGDDRSRHRCADHHRRRHLAGGTPHTGAVRRGSARATSVVNIRIPNSPIIVTRVGGTETMTRGRFHARRPVEPQHRRPGRRSSSRSAAPCTSPPTRSRASTTGTFDVTIQYP